MIIKSSHGLPFLLPVIVLLRIVIVGWRFFSVSMEIQLKIQSRSEMTHFEMVKPLGNAGGVVGKLFQEI